MVLIGLVTADSQSTGKDNRGSLNFRRIVSSTSQNIFHPSQMCSIFILFYL